jgi:hypothetical protein
MKIGKRQEQTRCLESAVGMIQGKPPQPGCTTLVPVAGRIGEGQTLLLIDAAEALQLLSPRPDRQAVVLTQMRMLSETMLKSVCPDAIVAPLITADYDIVDLGILLEELGYVGNLYAMTRPLPRAELVIREVGAVCPRLTVRLLEIA